MAKGTKTGGRKAGTPNKVTFTVKENVIAVFDQIGGQEQMAEWAMSNRSEFYRLYAKLLPHQVNTDVRQPGDASQISDDELAGILDAARAKAAH
jgi:hypothetical protein